MKPTAPRGTRRLLLGIAAALWSVGCGAHPQESPIAAARSVVLVSIDTLRPERLGRYGNAADVSPHIDALAREGTTFDDALAPSPWTLPSHMSLLTGLSPMAHGVGATRQALSSSVITLAQRLRERGFRTGAFTDARFLDSDYGFDRGFDVYEDERALRGPNGFARLLPRALDWAGQDEDPMFLFVHTFDVHARYDDTDPAVLARFRKRPAPDGPLDPLLAVTRHLHLMRLMGINRYGRLSQLLNDYDAGVHVADRGVGEIIAMLKQSGRFENALVIVTSDHGESFLDHGAFVGHGLSLTDDEIGIPLIIKFPSGEGAGERIVATVDLLDIAPTVLAAVGAPADPDLPGDRLQRLVRGEERTRGSFSGDSSNSGQHYLVEDGYKYISPPGASAEEVIRQHLGPQTPAALARTAPGAAYRMGELGGGTERRYDFDADPLGLRDDRPEHALLFERRGDPHEQNDLSSARPEVATKMRAHLQERLRDDLATARRFPDDGGRVDLDESERAQLTELGYLAPPDGDLPPASEVLADAAPNARRRADMSALAEPDRAVHRIRLALAERRPLPDDAQALLESAAGAYRAWGKANPEFAARTAWRLLELQELASRAGLPAPAPGGN